MSIPESNVDVLIIGAGPAGVMGAMALAKAGVNVKIVDQRPIKVAAGQADGIQPRTIEVLQSYGLAERLLREGNQMHLAAFYNPGPNGIERTGRAPDVTAPTARYPFEVTLHQGAIEAIFLDAMATSGVQVDRPIKPVSVELSQNEAELKDPNAHPVKVTLKRIDKEEGQNDLEIVNAKFVIGADGAHSWVRKSQGIQMEGEQTDYIWGVMDITPDTDFPDIRNKSAVHSENGSCMVIPREGDIVRLYVQLNDKDVLDPATGRVDKDRMGPMKIFETAEKSFHPYRIERPTEIDWWTIYIIGQRVASKFSVHERVFIVGDACHTHSPKAGQGMNASMNDSHNLAWKITHVLRGWADMSLLKIYELERRKYAQDLINFDRKFSSLFSGKPRTESNQDGVSHEQFLEAFQTFGGFTSGIGICYAPSLITNTTHQDSASSLTIGQRLLPQILLRAADGRPFEIQDLCPSDTRFKVLLFLGDIMKEEQSAKMKALSDAMSKPESFLNKFGGKKLVNNGWETFELISICSGSHDDLKHNDIPSILRPHWTKVFVDDESRTYKQGGKAYTTYGINPSQGAIVVVRPDGYVGIAAPLARLEDVEAYFAGFMKQRAT